MNALLLDAETEYAAARDALAQAKNAAHARPGYEAEARFRHAQALVDAWRTILESKGVAP